MKIDREAVMSEARTCLVGCVPPLISIATAAMWRGVVKHLNRANGAVFRAGVARSASKRLSRGCKT